MPHVPAWATQAGSLAHDLYSSQSIFLPRLKGPRPVVIMSHPTAFEEDTPLPSPVNSDEVPIPTKALMQGITDPKMVSNLLSPQASLPTPASAVQCDGWTPVATSIVDVVELHNLGSDGDATSFQISWEPSPSEWYERTSTHIMGMIVLMVIAIIIAEIYEKFLSCSRSRSGRSRRRGRGLRLEGSERRLFAESPLPVDEKQGSQEEVILEDEQEDFWSV